MRWEIKNPRTPKSNPSSHRRMTVMSLLVLVLSWGSMGLEAATAVVSGVGQALGLQDLRVPKASDSWILGQDGHKCFRS